MIRAGLDALLAALGKVAAPTGERGSILLMSGGLIVLGFLFLAFLFRSAIVGDLAPVANARLASPRVLLPPHPTLHAHPRSPAPPPSHAFEDGRLMGRDAGDGLDRAFQSLHARGVEARILQSRANWKRVRIYACASCAHDRARRGCEFERGLLAGTFEGLTGELAKVHEIACASRGAPGCEFEVRHSPLPEVV